MIRDPCRYRLAPEQLSSDLPAVTDHAANPTSAESRKLLASYRARIEAAQVYAVAQVSPLDEARKLSARLGNQVWLKREDLQPVHSFKLRGA